MSVNQTDLGSGNLCIWISAQLSADFCGSWTGKDKLAPAVFLAEPVSDIAAAAVTTAIFFTKIKDILEHGPKRA